jgi:XTP/dITP diphosphohydrolase
VVPSGPDRTPRVLLATRSAGKIRELRAMFAAAGVPATDLAAERIPELPAEDGLEEGTTYEENALSKARYFHALTGMASVADDSGIEVRALAGAPGVRSKRWSGAALSGDALDAANNQLLLRRLAEESDRRARYVCVAAYCDGERMFAERGETAGRIVATARGDGGFGYDPYFESEELRRTFAEVSMEEKARVSHRARAFAKLLQHLRAQR